MLAASTRRQFDTLVLQRPTQQQLLLAAAAAVVLGFHTNSSTATDSPDASLTLAVAADNPGALEARTLC
jgi:hypothetical protein